VSADTDGIGAGERAVDVQERSARSPSPADLSEVREVLLGALTNCRPKTIGALTETARLRTVRPEQVIYRQGEPAPLTLILRGFGAFRRTTVDGLHLSSGVGRAGDLFGFSSMASVASSVELIALTECRVAQWPGAEIRALAGVDPGLAIDAVDAMATALHAMIERVEGFLHQDSRRRVIRILARHQDLFFGDPAVLTRAHLPSLVGTSREMTGRVLRQLEREGTVERVGRTGLRLLRPDHLKAALK
jgi:CRP/FNR family transcriptional regulator, cyclic AMP receptor protein